MPEPCGWCEGTGKEFCEACDGETGAVFTCALCDGNGAIDGKVCPDCEGRPERFCTECGGAGEYTCSECNGAKTIECEEADDV